MSGFWSLTLYDEHHFFVPNDLKRYSLGTKNAATVVVGDVDKVENEPGLQRELASRISGTEFIILPGVGHLSPLEAPGELAAAITTAITKMR